MKKLGTKEKPKANKYPHVNIYDNYALEDQYRKPVQYFNYQQAIYTTKDLAKPYSFANATPLLQKVRLITYFLIMTSMVIGFSMVIEFIICDESVYQSNFWSFYALMAPFTALILSTSILFIGFTRSLITLFACGVMFIISYFLYTFLERILQITETGYRVLVIGITCLFIFSIYIIGKHINNKRMTNCLNLYMGEDFSTAINLDLKYALPIEEYDNVVKVTLTEKENLSSYKLPLTKLEYITASHKLILACVYNRINEPYLELYIFTKNINKATKILKRHLIKLSSFNHSIEALCEKPEDVYNRFYPSTEQLELDRNQNIFDGFENNSLDMSEEVPITFTVFFADKTAAQKCSEKLQTQISFDNVGIINNSEEVEKNHAKKYFSYILHMMKMQPLNRANINAQCKMIISTAEAENGQYNSWNIGQIELQNQSEEIKQ